MPISFHVDVEAHMPARRRCPLAIGLCVTILATLDRIPKSGMDHPIYDGLANPNELKSAFMLPMTPTTLQRRRKR